MKYQFKWDDAPWNEVDSKTKRKLTARGPEMSISYYEFEEGGGSLTDYHSHEHAQVTHIISGKFIFVVDDVQYEVGAGDSMYNPPNKPHTALCIEKGQLLDVFNPIRADQVPEGEDLNLK